MVSVCLAAKADGTKLQPFIVFKAAKRDIKALDEEFKNQCFVQTPGNAWLNEKLTMTWVKRVVGAFSLNRPLIAWDSYECHTTDALKKELNEMKVDQVINLVDAPNTSRHLTCVGIGPSKLRVTELYD